MPPTNNHGLTFSDPDSNSTYAPNTYHGFPSGYGSIKIVATMATSGLDSSIKLNSPFTQSSEQSGRFTTAIQAKQLILVKGMSDSQHPDHCNGYQEDRVTVIGGNETVVSVSPYGNSVRIYKDAEEAMASGYTVSTKRGTCYENNNFDYGNNFVWVPPNTLIQFTISRAVWRTRRVYHMANTSNKYICYHINKLRFLWSMKLPDNTDKIWRSYRTNNGAQNEFFIITRYIG
jgi:hypothetical protein